MEMNRCPLSIENGEVDLRTLPGATHLHNNSLHDEDGDVYGETVDPTTGDLIINSFYTGLEALTVLTPGHDGSEDILPPLPLDEIDAWIKSKGGIVSDSSQNDSTAA